MSVHVISWVLAHSEATLADRLVLIVLADHANADGTGAYPKIKTIGGEARVSDRQAQRSLRNLEAAGEIKNAGKTKRGVTVWTVTMQGRQSVTPDGANVTPRGVEIVTPSVEPSLEPSGPQHPSGVVALNGNVTPSAQTLVGDVVDACRADSIPISARARGMIGQQAADLLSSGFEYELVVAAAVLAIRRGEPQHAWRIASDIAVASAGKRLTRKEYERALEDEVEIAAWERKRHDRA